MTTPCKHRVDSVIEGSLYRLQNYALVYSNWNFCEKIMNDIKAIPEY